MQYIYTVESSYTLYAKRLFCLVFINENCWITSQYFGHSHRKEVSQAVN